MTTTIPVSYACKQYNTPISSAIRDLHDYVPSHRRAQFTWSQHSRRVDQRLIRGNFGLACGAPTKRPTSPDAVTAVTAGARGHRENRPRRDHGGPPSWITALPHGPAPRRAVIRQIRRVRYCPARPQPPVPALATSSGRGGEPKPHYDLGPSGSGSQRGSQGSRLQDPSRPRKVAVDHQRLTTTTRSPVLLSSSLSLVSASRRAVSGTPDVTKSGWSTSRHMRQTSAPSFRTSG